MAGNCYSCLLTTSNVSICKVNNVIKMNPECHYFNQTHVSNTKDRQRQIMIKNEGRVGCPSTVNTLEPHHVHTISSYCLQRQYLCVTVSIATTSRHTRTIIVTDCINESSLDICLIGLNQLCLVRHCSSFTFLFSLSQVCFDPMVSCQSH